MSWRPRDKQELLRAMERGWLALRQQLTELKETQLAASGPDGWSARDHLAHLAAWENSLVSMFSRRPRYEGLGVAAETYASGDFDRINAEIHARVRELSLNRVLSDLGTVHARLLEALAGLGDADLQRSCAHYLPGEPWADPELPAMELIVRNTYEHYAEHLPAIRAALHLPASLTMADAERHLRRTDALTGCGNLVGLLEWLLSQGGAVQFSGSLLAVDLNFMEQLNANHGHAQGDAALRWMGLVLTDETRAPVFRSGGDEFVAVLTGGVPEERLKLTERIFARLNSEAGRVGVEPPAATLALVHYTSKDVQSPGRMLIGLDAALADVKRHRNRTLGAYSAMELPDSSGRSYMLDSLIRHMVRLENRLDESQQLALTDPVTGLPNLRAALQQLEAALSRADAAGQPLAMLMVDGDDLQRFNQHGYQAGDRMIQDLGAALQGELRPGDFLARWRVGDEFLILLPNTTAEAAWAAGQRLCQAVRVASVDWLYPVTISVGLSIYPDHAGTQDGAITAAEAAKDAAKSQGKDRVAAPPEPYF